MALVITSAVITNLGENMLAQVVAGEGAMTLSSVEFGSGYPAANDIIANYTGLNNPVMPGVITGANNVVQSQTTIRCNISSSNAPIAFQVNEIGIYAQLGTSAPVLFAYTSTGGPTGDTITPSSATSAIVKDYALLILFTQQVPTSTTIAMEQVVGLHAKSHVLPGGVDPLPICGSNVPGVGIADGLVPVGTGTGHNVLTDTNPVSWGSGVPVAVVLDYAGTVIPAGYVFTDGASYLRSALPDLFASIGTTHGQGSSPGLTFNVPDCRSRTIIMAGQGVGLTTRPLGAIGGAESVILDPSTIPPHTHVAFAIDHTHIAYCATIDHIHSWSGGAYDHSHNAYGIYTIDHSHSVGGATYDHTHQTLFAGCVDHAHAIGEHTHSTWGEENTGWPYGTRGPSNNAGSQSTDFNNPFFLAGPSGLYSTGGSNYGGGYSIPCSVSIGYSNWTGQNRGWGTAYPLPWIGNVYGSNYGGGYSIPCAGNTTGCNFGGGYSIPINGAVGGSNYGGGYSIPTNIAVYGSNYGGGYSIPVSVSANTGGGYSHGNMQPWIALYKIIRT